MSEKVLCALIAFVIGSIVPVLELVTGTYPRTFYLIKRCKALYLYGLMFGLVAAVTAVISSILLANGTIKLQGPMIESPYIQAIVIGISVKAVLHINIFTLTSGKTATPIGFETFTRFFEAGLLRDLKFFEFMKINGYLAGYVKNLTLEEARAKAKANIPPALAKEEREEFILDIDDAKTVQEVLELFLRFAGHKAFEWAFKV
jgi:hypothetical protein